MFRFGFRRKKKDTIQDQAVKQLEEKPVGEEVAQDAVCSFSGAVFSDVGCVRPNNEDNYVFAGHMNDTSANRSEAAAIERLSGEWHFAGVFDGMGGGEIGEQASHDTAEIFLAAFEQLSGNGSRDDMDRVLFRTFLDANNHIVSLQKSYNVYGTTGTVLCTNGQEMKLYHLGDSRAYRLRDNMLVQLTVDQTLAQLKKEMGMYRENDPAAEADKHKLTDYIGRDRTQENLRPVESQWLSVRKHDRVLLCSDGLYDMCTETEIAEILSRDLPAPEIAEQLTEAAKATGGEDNITCAVILFS